MEILDLSFLLMAWVGETHECNHELEDGFSIRQTLPPSWTVRQMSMESQYEREDSSAATVAVSRQELGFCYRRLSQGSDTKYSPRFRSSCSIACGMRTREMETQIKILSDMNENLKYVLRREQQTVDGLSKALLKANDEMRAVSESCSKALQENIHGSDRKSIVFENLRHSPTFASSSDPKAPGDIDIQPLKKAQQLCVLTEKLRQDVETAVSTILRLESETGRLKLEAASRHRELELVKEIETRNISLNQEVEYLR